MSLFSKCAAVLMFVTATPVAASTIFQSSVTGADLVTTAGVSIPGASVGSGTNLLLSPTAVSQQILSWDILPAGAYGNLTITSELRYLAGTADNDLIWGLTDGSNWVASQRVDNEGGRIATLSGTLNSALASPILTSSTSSFFVGDGSILTGPFSSVTTLEFGTGIATRSLDSGANVLAAATMDLTLNPQAGLSFFIVGGDITEQYVIESLSITVDNVPVTAVPLPAGLPLMIAGLAGFGLLRRRRK